MSEASVRFATTDDLPAIVALERGIPEAPHWTDVAYREYLGRGSGEMLKKALLVATAAGAIRGFVALTVLSDEGEIESIGVGSDARRLGMGTRLMQAAEDWAEAQGAGTLKLEVRAANIPARAFYESRAFKQTGMRREYYRHPVDDAVLMCRALQNGPAAHESEA